MTPYLRTMLGSWLLGTALVAQAAYPDKPIRIVVGFPPGQATDMVARVLAKKLQDALQQPVFVDNKPGASGIIGTEMVVKAPPDGYTLLVGSSGTLAINPSLYSKLPYKPLTDLTHISQIANVPLFLAVNKDFPAQSAADFVREVKAQPGKFSYGSAGSGVTSHLTMELFKQQAGLFILHVPYKGSPAAVTDLIGGQVQAMVDTGPALLAHAKNGKLRVLAVAAPARSVFLPQVPTLRELGFPLNVREWYGFFLPGKVSAEVQRRAAEAIGQALAQPDVVEAGRTYGLEIKASTPSALNQMLQADAQQWRQLIRQAGFTAES